MDWFSKTHCLKYQILIYTFVSNLFVMLFARIYVTGQDIELLYLVKGYGIPVDHIPLTGTGNVKTLNLKVWMKLRTRLEGENEEFGKNIIECPGSNDVLFRPSKMIKGHPGNVKFHSLIESYHEKGFGITAASKEIIAQIFEWNGRILIWDKRGWWTKVTDPGQMQFKVSVSYRDYKKKNRSKPQFNDSSTYAFQDVKKRKRIELESGLLSSSSVPNTNVCEFLSSDTAPLIRKLYNGDLVDKT